MSTPMDRLVEEIGEVYQGSSLEDALYRAEKSYKELLEALKVLETYASSQTCTHDDTHRGGSIWEICDQCGAMWADDKGGKPKFKWPKEIEAARAAIAKAEGA